MVPLKIDVKKAHIENATQKDSHKCMIADAIHQSVPWARYVMVDLQSVRFSHTKSGRRFIYLTPPHGQQAIVKFDQGQKVRPFSMTLSQGYTRKMRVHQGKVDRTKRYKKKRIPTRVMPSRFREFGVRSLR